MRSRAQFRFSVLNHGQFIKRGRLRPSFSEAVTTRARGCPRLSFINWPAVFKAVLYFFETAWGALWLKLQTCWRHFSCSGKSVYLDYYGLTEPPFDITPNPRFLFYSARHREAYNHLLYGIRERKGFVQLTGEVGAGKTTLCRAMLDQLDGHFATALILNPVMSADELM